MQCNSELNSDNWFENQQNFIYFCTLDSNLSKETPIFNFLHFQDCYFLNAIFHRLPVANLYCW